VSWRTDTKLKSGVSLIRLYLRRTVPIESCRINRIHLSDVSIRSESIDIINCSTSNDNKTYRSMDSFQLTNVQNYDDLMIEYDRTGSSGETGFDTDRAEDVSSPSTTNSMSRVPSNNDNQSWMSSKVLAHSFICNYHWQSCVFSYFSSSRQ
jgi:hypothetical protein